MQHSPPLVPLPLRDARPFPLLLPSSTHHATPSPAPPPLLVHSNTYCGPAMQHQHHSTVAQQHWCWPSTGIPSSLDAINKLYNTFITPRAGSTLVPPAIEPSDQAHKNLQLNFSAVPLEVQFSEHNPKMHRNSRHRAEEAMQQRWGWRLVGVWLEQEC